MAKVTNQHVVNYCNRQLKPRLARLMAIIRDADPIVTATFTAKHVDPVVEAADDADTIDNTSGLAGATPTLTVAQFKKLRELEQTILGAVNANMADIVDALGIGNVE